MDACKFILAIFLCFNCCDTYIIKFKYNCLPFLFLFFQIPVVANALGGILVGLVTSLAGGVRKVSITT